LAAIHLHRLVRKGRERIQLVVVIGEKARQSKPHASEGDCTSSIIRRSAVRRCEEEEGSRLG